MRITGIETTPVAVPFGQDEGWAFGVRKGMICLLVQVTTDEGVTGVGEAAAYPSADIVAAVLDSVAPLVVGEDPMRIERIMKRINVVGTWHHVKATSPAIAAVEMACWDIVGKVCGQPLVNLFGGRVRDAVEYFYYLPRKPAADLVTDAAAGARAGFSTFYLKVGSDDPRVDIDRVAAIRDGAGPDAKIRVDANEAWSTSAAVRVLTQMHTDAGGIELAEQPISGRNLPEMTHLRQQLPMPVLANEASWTRWDQLEVIRYAAADVMSVDNQMDGGLLNLKRSAGMAETAGLPVLKHSLGELGIAAYAAAHVIAATPNFTHANQGYASLLTDDVVTGGPLPYVDGCLEIPDAPGIGVTLDDDKVATYAELYAKNKHDFAFTDTTAMSATPVMPKF